jgi:hypothetical protein
MVRHSIPFKVKYDRNRIIKFMSVITNTSQGTIEAAMGIRKEMLEGRLDINNIESSPNLRKKLGSVTRARNVKRFLKNAGFLKKVKGKQKTKREMFELEASSDRAMEVFQKCVDIMMEELRENLRKAEGWPDPHTSPSYWDLKQNILEHRLHRQKINKR